MPEPTRRVTIPSDCSSRIALNTVIREAPKRLTSSASLGKRLPGLYRPEEISS